MTAFRFSANTGFLWRELPFLERIRRAAANDFDVVEFHDEAQNADPQALAEVLAETGLPVLGLNVRMGETAGCAAIAGREDEARRDIDAAIEIADTLGAAALHVLAGRTGDTGSDAAYKRALHYALDASDLIILIEPICRAAIPDYFLHDLNQAAAIIDEIDHPRLKILFDCYHIETAHGELLQRFHQHQHRVGHIQIASVPDRSEPDSGTIDFANVLPALRKGGYEGAFGCEYKPKSTVEAGLGWRDPFR